jgi:hypothetical protein
MFKRKPENETQRYDQLPNVKIDESRIPAPLRPLLPFARAWSISCDDALERAIRVAGHDEIARAVEAGIPMRDAIHDFAYRSAGASAIPVPDEVVLFQMFAASLERLRYWRG